MGRKIVAFIAAVFAGAVVILAVNVLGQELVQAQRNGAITSTMMLVTALAWFLGALAAGLLAQRIDHSPRPVPALLAGLLLLALAVHDMTLSVPPMWFRVLGVFVFLPGIIFGILIGKRGGRRRRVRHT